MDAASRARRGVNKSLVSNEHAINTWLKRAFKNPQKLAQLDALLAAYPGRSTFHAKTDLLSRDFLRQLMDCYAYLEEHLAGELDAIKCTETVRWKADGESQAIATPFDAAKAMMQGAQSLLAVTAALSLKAEPGAFFSGHVALAVPGIAALGLATTLVEAAKNQTIRSHHDDPASLWARIERILP